MGGSFFAQLALRHLAGWLSVLRRPARHWAWGERAGIARGCPSCGGQLTSALGRAGAAPASRRAARPLAGSAPVALWRALVVPCKPSREKRSIVLRPGRASTHRLRCCSLLRHGQHQPFGPMLAAASAAVVLVRARVQLPLHSSAAPSKHNWCSMTAHPSIERTAKSTLRVLSSAAHVER